MKKEKPKEYSHYIPQEYRPIEEVPARAGADQHRQYRSGGQPIPRKETPGVAGKWHANLGEKNGQ